MILLIYRSYMDKKKYMILAIFEILVISFLIIMTYEKDSVYEMMLNPRYYQVFYEQLFCQVFMILNAMFVLFLAMEHDQSFFKPFIAYFDRSRVVLAKYMFHIWMIMMYLINVFMMTKIIFEIFMPITIEIDIMLFIDLALDLCIVSNLILILTRQKYKTVSVIIVLFYILSNMFIQDGNLVYYYLFPIFNIQKKLNLLELIYKICYIYLGFLVYIAKSLQEEL